MAHQRHSRRRAVAEVRSAESFRNGMPRRWHGVGERTAKRIESWSGESSARHRRLSGLKDRALTAPCGAARVIFSGAPGAPRRGATLGDTFAQGCWGGEWPEKGTDWWELRTLIRALGGGAP